MPATPIKIVDSHTAGEPTRLVIDGAPDLGNGSMAERLERFRENHDAFRSLLINEPRGHDVVVGGLLCAPVSPDSTCGIIFFNNAGYLGMCGHGTIGLMATLAHIGEISEGSHTVETPVGNVVATLHDPHRVSVRNIPSYRYKKQVAVTLDGGDTIHGDIAWGGNWFFLVSDHGQELSASNTDTLIGYAAQIRKALEKNQVTGKDGAMIDHVELLAPPATPDADSKNFVLCPGLEWDRSPCGTGLSAKLACLAADGDLNPGELWRQAGILDTVFEGQYEVGDNGNIIPTITGSAYITAESNIVVQDNDPFPKGIEL